MKDQSKTKQALIQELASLRKKVEELERIIPVYRIAEERLHAVNECLLSLGNDVDDNIRRLTALTGALMGATASIYNRLEGDVLVAVGQWQTPTDFKTKDRAQGHLCYDVICKNDERIVHIRNLPTSPYSETDPNIRAYGLATYIGHVVRWGSEPVGSLCVVFQQDFIPSADDEGLLGIMASSIGSEERRRRNENVVHESEARFHSLFQNVPNVAVQGYGPDGTTQYWNQASERLYGYTAQEAIGRNLMDLIIPPEMRGDVEQAIQQMAETGQPIPASELSLMRKDGSRVALFSSHAIVQVPGREPELFCIDIDLTERKRAEDALQDSKERFRLLAENARDTIWTMDMNLQYTYMSPYVKHALDYTPEEYVALPLNETMTPASLELCMQVLAEELEIEKREDKDLLRSRTVEVEHIHRNGNIVWAEIKMTFMRNNAGQATGILGYTRDITERKGAEEALKKSEEMLRLITDNMSDMIRVTDLQGVVIYISPSHFKGLGYRPEERVGKSAFDIIHPEDLERIINIFSEGLAANRRVNVEYRVRHADGHYVWLETVGDLLRDAQGNVTAIVMSSRDFSQRKATAEELSRNEEKYRTLIETTRTGFVILDQDGLVLDANPEYVRLTGHHDLSEIVGRSVIDWTADHEKEKNTAAVGECFGKGYIRNLEIDYVDSKGNITPIEINATCMESGGVTQILTLCRDITARKKAEEELLIKDRAIASSFNAIAISDLDGRLTYVNDAFLNIWGYSAQEALNINAADLASSKDEINQIINDIQEKGFSLGESIAIRKNGSLFNIQFSASLITSSENKPIAMLSTFLDITERKQTEEALRESEKLYRSLIECSSDAIFCVDEKGQYQFVNTLFATTFGKFPEYFKGKTFWDIYPKEHADYRYATTQRVIQTGKSESIEVEVPLPDKALFFYATANPIKDETGKVVMVLTHAVNITERKRAEEARFEVLARFSGFADASQYGMGMADLDGRITFANATLARMLGEKTAEDCLGKHFPTAYYSPSMTQKLQEEVLPALMSVGHWHGELELQTVDGRSVPTEENYFVIRDKQGRIRNLADILTDITDRKRVEEEREKLQAQLARAQKMESIGTLAGGIAHDFNNLLMGIQGHASLMMLGLDPSDPNNVRLKHIEELVQSGSDLTNQLLGFARGGRYDVKPVSMNDIVEKSSAMFGRTKKEINIYRKYAKDPCIVEADRSQMEQVFMNLFVNAWQAMPGGGDMFVETEEVVLDEIHAMPGRVAPGRYVKVTVTDTGTGMDAQTKERIFDPFFTTKGMGRGTGLGLATVYGIMRGHGGMITAESEPGQGTSFILYLPASEKDPAGEKDSGEGVLRGTEGILLVDDEKMVLEVSRELLEYLGYRVYAAGSGQEAVAVYMEKRNKIDLVILDLVMPGMSGGETFDRLREIDLGIKVLLSSGYSINGQAREILDRGCDGFIQKPFRLKELSRWVREALD